MGRDLRGQNGSRLGPQAAFHGALRIPRRQPRPHRARRRAAARAGRVVLRRALDHGSRVEGGSVAAGGRRPLFPARATQELSPQRLGQGAVLRRGQPWMEIRDGFVGSIGNTPLIRLRRVSEATGCNVLGKAEFLNPGGSVKDRAALYMILDAEQRGALKPGGVIVEGTAGNTGIGLALVGNARGYRTVIVIPDTQSQEKKDMLRLCGAELREVPAVPYKDPNNYVHVSERTAKELGGFWANQWDNTANRDGHYRSTGPEIWEQTDGRVDGFTCAIGTGGTLAGVSRYLKEKNPRIRTVASDPMGAAMYSWFKRKEIKSEGSSVTEGIGLGRVTKNVEGAQLDDAYQIPDAEALPFIFDLLKHEGLCIGGSSGINVAGAVRLAKELGPGHTVVTILADSGTRYQSKLFNPAFLKAKGLPCPDWL